MNFRQFAFNNVFRNKRTYAAYFLSSAFSVMIFFIYSVIAFHPEMQEGMVVNLASQAMKIAQWIVYVFSFFFILYSVSAFLKTRQHEFGVLMMQGMSHRQMNRLVFLENMIIGIASIIVGIVVGLVMAKVGLVVGGNMMDVQLSYYIAPKALTLTGGSFFVLFIVISFLTQFMIGKSKVIQLLQGTNKPKPEPKASLLLSLLAAILLGGGYFLAATANAGTIGILMLPVIVMTIIGSYFLFTQLSVFIINLIKKNRNFFWRRTNLITISDLAYRMKDNARMFFMVCIVSTVAFCAVGSLASFGVLGKQTELSYPFQISYLSKEDNKRASEHLDRIEADFKNANAIYEKVTTTVLYQTSKQSESGVSLLSASEYNKLAALLHIDPIQLKGTDAMVMPHNFEYKKILGAGKRDITLKESGIKLRSIGVAEGPVISQGMGSNWVIISDEVVEKIQGSSKKGIITGYRLDAWEDAKDVGQHVNEELKSWYEAHAEDREANPSFGFTSLADLLAMQNQMYSIMMFSALLVGAVFFIASGSFLYFRLYTDLEQDKERYKAIGKIGLKDKELSKIATTQLLLLFFIPIIVAIIHSVFAFMALQSLMDLSIAGQAFKVLGGFTVAQIIYFMAIRWRYMKHLREALH
ncbi:FtsX-like permease family protein [Paenibacillus taiwanensis]|uniref:FtsX-like permease family protein n=1 Tax=Paenibacillus taiwanensis TaxID=401638 RepID=UPI0004275F02|nr:ABC transporter permease [Paenibacillus taiwanensis]